MYVLMCYLASWKVVRLSLKHVLELGVRPLNVSVSASMRRLVGAVPDKDG